MSHPIRKSTFPFEVEVEGLNPEEKNLIKDIYITELGYVMVSIFNEEKKVCVNYICGELKNILPAKIKIKEEVNPQSSLLQPSRDDRFSSSL